MGWETIAAKLDSFELVGPMCCKCVKSKKMDVSDPTCL